MIQFDLRICFKRGWVQPPPSLGIYTSVSLNGGTPISHPKCWSFLVGKTIVVGKKHHLRKHPYILLLGGGFKYVLFNSYLGKIPILTNVFQRGWFNHQLDMLDFRLVNFQV